MNKMKILYYPLFMFVLVTLSGCIKEKGKRFDYIENYEFPCHDIDTSILDHYLTSNIRDHCMNLENFVALPVLSLTSKSGQWVSFDDATWHALGLKFNSYDTPLDSSRFIEFLFHTPYYPVDTPLYRAMDDMLKYYQQPTVPIESSVPFYKDFFNYSIVIYFKDENYISDSDHDFPILWTSNHFITDPDYPDDYTGDQYRRYVKLVSYEREDLGDRIWYKVKMKFDVNLYYIASFRYYGPVKGEFKGEFILDK